MVTEILIECYLLIMFVSCIFIEGISYLRIIAED